MQPERQYAVTVVMGVAAFGACLALQTNGLIAISVGLVYATAAYYLAEDPSVLRDRSGPSWESATVGGVSAFAAASLVQVDPGAGVLLLAIGLAYFGIVIGHVTERRRDD